MAAFGLQLERETALLGLCGWSLAVRKGKGTEKRKKKSEEKPTEECVA
jgi:hypothetical protein